ncbi:toll-like receptor 2 type-2 isoform X1 [Dreissena polymorpha]|uniref:toll-like receptor 2 type-2 isoform X1 n=1 Tax=Dreissena polymorpha TaxID=45954 RepID=UPI00226441C6|nr:toll-like receptor 2 type-2 isoform X1 [Dreissena polymorpha]
MDSVLMTERLQEVIVDGIQSEGTSSYLTLDDEFFEALTGNKKRRIKILSMSNTKLLSISFESISRYGVCNSIEVFIARNVSTVNLDNGYKIHRGYSFYGEPCKTLRTVDISGAKNVLFQSNLWYLDLFPFYCASLVSFFFNTNDIIANDIDLKYPLYFGMNGPKHLDMTECPIKIRKFSFSNSRLAKLNVHTHLNAVTISSFQIADVSSNELEYVSPQLLASSVNIKYINVSTNKLHVMQESHTRDFERLLWALRKLEILDLSQNGIFSIPRLMFINTTSLEYLDLSMNKLQSIDFVIQHLVRLKTFNLQRNWFLMIDENTQLVLDNLNYRQLNSTDEGLVIDLSHNNFICTCDTVVINSIKWMETLPKELLAGDLNNYKCDLDGAQVNIVRGGLQETKSYCRLQKALLALAICLPPTVSAIAAILIKRFIRQRKQRRQQRRQQKIDIGLERLRNETFPKKYLVFFSFCSEDAVAATNLFFTELEKRLKDIVDTPRNLVCIGDRNFRPGHPIGEEIIRCIDESAVTILAVSNAFCKKHWCKREIQETYDQDKPIILLMLEHVEPETMGIVLHKLFERYTIAKLVFEDCQIRLEPDWAIFCDSIINLSMKYLDE